MQPKFEIEGDVAAFVVCQGMTDAIDEIRKLLELYPSWLVLTCLAIVAAGILYVVWRIVKFGIVLMVTALLIALVVFAGWTLFAS